VLLHGYAMEPSDLASLADAMTLPASLYLPRGIHPAVPQGHAWWPVDASRRAAQMAEGARDLFNEHPPGREHLRLRFGEFISELRLRHGNKPLILAGFSQGGMLACDLLLRGAVRPQGLVLMSTSCIAIDEWQPRFDQARELPVLVTHGEADADISFTAGQRVRDHFIAAGASVTWFPFSGGHGAPLVVWREFRRFTITLLRSVGCM
jgi:phospholipase/carboxylesterase